MVKSGAKVQLFNEINKFIFGLLQVRSCLSRRIVVPLQPIRIEMFFRCRSLESKSTEKYNRYMKTFLKYLGLIILLLGVVCFVCYQYALQQNYMLLIGIILEVVGLVVFVITNKYIY